MIKLKFFTPCESCEQPFYKRTAGNSQLFYIIFLGIT